MTMKCNNSRSIGYFLWQDGATPIKGGLQMHKLLIAVAAVFLITSSAHAQKAGWLKMGYMSNDIIINGKILSSDKGTFFIKYKGHLFYCHVTPSKSVCYVPESVNAKK
jgi:hypothetical protein